MQPLGREDALEEGTAAHSSVLAWRIPGAEKAGCLQPTGSQRVRHCRIDLTHNTHNYNWLLRVMTLVMVEGEGMNQALNANLKNWELIL